MSTHSPARLSFDLDSSGEQQHLLEDLVMLMLKVDADGNEKRLEVSDEVLAETVRMVGTVALKAIESPEYLKFVLENQDKALAFVEKMAPVIIDLIDKADRRSRTNREQEERRTGDKNYQQRAR